MSRETQEDGNEEVQTKTGRGRGFLSMTPERRREIASKGGKSAHEQGLGHRFTHDQAVEAGRKGGRKRAEVMKQKKEGEYLDE